MSRETIAIDPKEMARKAEKIYTQIQPDLEPAYKGQVVAIDGIFQIGGWIRLEFRRQIAFPTG